MKKILRNLTKNWIDNNSAPAFDFSSRAITSYYSGNVVLLGMRRLGKTEYLKFRYQEFFKKDEKESLEPKNINGDMGSPIVHDHASLKKTLFVDFDSPKLTGIDFDKKESGGFVELTNSIMEIIEEDAIELVLIDEIQSRIEWTRWLKGMVDHFPDVTFVATGSDAVKMKSSGESGGLRFKTIFIGPITYKEYLLSHRYSEIKSKDVVDYFDNVVHPIETIDKNSSDLYTLVIEKQINQANMRSSNIQSVFKAICLNPGRDVNSNAISTTTKMNSDSKVDNKQTELILDFLVDSKLIIRLENLYTKERASKRNEYKYYPSSWNGYKFFSLQQSIRELNQDTIPKSGFVFENVVISNVMSSLHERLDADRVSYMDNKKGKECDLVIKDMYIEIKSMDLSKKRSEMILNSTIKKMKQFENPIIVHTGETFECNDIKIYSYEEFLKGQPWIQEKK